MTQELEKAKHLLESEGYTCVLCRDNRVHTSRQRGVQPLLELLHQGRDLNGFSAADKVVGKATAMLYRLLGVKEIYAPVISEAALQALEEGNIRVFYSTRVPYIINRTADGCCPMEAATANIRDPRKALEAIEHTLANLRGTT